MIHFHGTGQKAQAILKRHLLRRTKESTIVSEKANTGYVTIFVTLCLTQDGKPILTLGPKTINIIELEFTPDERIVRVHIASVTLWISSACTLDVRKYRDTAQENSIKVFQRRHSHEKVCTVHLAEIHGDSQKHDSYTFILVMILRLRQLCG